jgi:MoaA/NifB/PqqE/SkfB family radical SAM enzyme
MNQDPSSQRRVDLKVGFSCNNSCRFCVQGHKRGRFPDKSTAELKAALEEARGGADGVVFTGGEVTLRRDLFELLAHARALGFSRIQLQSNCRVLAYPEFCRRAVEAGANEFSPALHGHVPALHDYLTRAPGSFVQTVQAIRNLRALGQRVISNSVICRPNYRHLEQLAALLLSLGVQQYQFAFIHAIGTAAENLEAMMPRVSLVAPHLRRALTLGGASGVRAYCEAVPYCHLQGVEWAASERIIPQTRIVDADFVLEDYTRFRLEEGKAKGPDCARCTWTGVCEGPWREYPQRYGWQEFEPRTDAISAELFPGGGDP